MAIQFKCPKCRHGKLECCLDGPHTCPITEIDQDGDFEYGEYESTADVDRYQCAVCGYTLKENGDNITDNLDVAEWCKKNCSQE